MNSRPPAGWSVPCGRTVRYRQRVQLRATAPKVRRAAIVRHDAVVTTARFALYDKPLPRIEAARRQTSAVLRRR